MKYTKWSEKEVEELNNLYPNVRVKDLLNKFPNRSPQTIVAKALSLNLPSAKLWQLRENALLRKYFSVSTREELTELLPHRSWSAIIAQGERLGLRRIVNKPRKIVNESYFKQWSPNMAYLLGFILADGCIVKGTYKGYSDSLKFGVQLKDINILEKIRKELGASHKISVVKNAVHLSIASQKMVNDLKRLGINYRKSLNEQVPEVPKKYIKEFIRGIIDGDGGVGIDKKGYPTVGVCGGDKVINFIRDHLSAALNVHYSKVGRREYSEKCKNYLYQVGYKGNTALRILDYIYNVQDGSVYLDRKYIMAKKCLEAKERKNIYEWYEPSTG